MTRGVEVQTEVRLGRQLFPSLSHSTCLQRSVALNMVKIGLTTQNPFVLIESSDGYSFVVKREVALASGMLKNMLDEDSE